MEYHLPVTHDKTKTAVWIKNYEIKNKTAFDSKEKENGEGTLLLELTFTSNDYSPDKYKKFLEEFSNFLNSSGYSSGKHD